MDKIPNTLTHNKEGFKIVLKEKRDREKKIHSADKILYPNSITITQLVNINEKKETKKEGKRPSKKDDFDYKSYIEKEIQRLDAQNMEKNAKRKLIQKIRNKMSAQRSRERSKNMMKHLQEENKEMKDTGECKKPNF